jgi:hypothetical protein
MKEMVKKISGEDAEHSAARREEGTDNTNQEVEAAKNSGDGFGHIGSRL